MTPFDHFFFGALYTALAIATALNTTLLLASLSDAEIAAVKDDKPTKHFDMYVGGTRLRCRYPRPGE